MAAKGWRIAGTGSDGADKDIAVDANGNLQTSAVSSTGVAQEFVEGAPVFADVHDAAQNGGTAFIGRGFMSSPTENLALGDPAYRQGIFELWNPAGSGKNLILDYVKIDNQSLAANYTTQNFVLLPHFLTTVEVTSAAIGGNIRNKDGTATASIAETRGTAVDVTSNQPEASAAAKIGSFLVGFADVASPCSTNIERTFKGGIAIPPGSGWYIGMHTQTTSGANASPPAVDFEFREKPI